MLQDRLTAPIVIASATTKAAALYVQAIESRGGTARVLTYRERMGAGEALKGAGGLLLTGGLDIHPRFYGQEPDPVANVRASVARDEVEFALLREALTRDMPVLGICRGMQLINVAFGGSLLQDIQGHRLWKADRHPLFVSPGSKLGAIVGAGARHRTNSRHHQGLKDPQKAPELLASAYMVSDGVIEGLESPAHSWVIGVQCHPERENEVPKSFLNLFDNLLDWAGRYGKR